MEANLAELSDLPKILLLFGKKCYKFELKIGEVFFSGFPQVEPRSYTMNVRNTLFFLLFLSLAAFIAFTACGDDDDDDENDNDESMGGGVCWYECTYMQGAQVYESHCYGEGGAGNLATEALKTDAECEEFAQEACESQDKELTQYLFDENCVSCDDAACEPDWLEEY